ncbi:hypothetical protein DL770_001802 [Monosporascus sp. CRB-9-2]|nr:hypothetical protein DL770_001802 [Monosporascus sp. CRB-9-2]
MRNWYGGLYELLAHQAGIGDRLDMGYKQFITPGYEAVRTALVDIGHIVFQGGEMFVGRCFNSGHRHCRPGELEVLEDRELQDYGVKTVMGKMALVLIAVREVW